MSGSNIRLNYIEARKQVDELHAHADELRSASKRYADQLADLEGAWQGPEAQKFVESARRRVKAMAQIAKKLDDVARAMERTAELYQRSELQKLRLPKR